MLPWPHRKWSRATVNNGPFQKHIPCSLTSSRTKWVICGIERTASLCCNYPKNDIYWQISAASVVLGRVWNQTSVHLIHTRTTVSAVFGRNCKSSYRRTQPLISRQHFAVLLTCIKTYLSASPVIW